MSAQTVVIFGDSHSEAVRRALEARRQGGRASSFLLLDRHTTHDRFTGEFYPSFFQLISELRPHDVVVSMLGGRQYAFFGMVQHPQPFDFFTIENPLRCRSHVEVIPFRAVEAAMTEAIIDGVDVERGIVFGDGRRLHAVRAATKARVLHVIPPPPTHDNDYIVSRHESEFGRQGIAGAGVAPPELRLKLWRLQTRILEHFCCQNDIEPVPPPVEAMHNGFLRDKYRRKAIHANWRYGELLLQTLEAETSL